MAAVDRMVPDIVNTLQAEDEYECVNQSSTSLPGKTDDDLDMKVSHRITPSQPIWQQAHLLALQ